MTALVSLHAFAPSPGLLRQAAAVRPALQPGQMVVHKGSFVEQRIALKDAFILLRGARAAANKKFVPKTTNADVLKVIRYWTDAVEGFGKKKGASQSGRDRWFEKARAYLSNIISKKDGAEFSANEEFWQGELARVAIWLDSLSAVPSRYKMAIESISESASERKDDVVDAAKTVASGVVDVASNVADGVGTVLAAPLKGFARSLGVTPTNAALALAAVGGIGYLTLRSRKKRKTT